MRVARGQIWHLPRLALILWAFTRATPWLPLVRSRRADLRALIVVIRRGWVRVIRDGQGVVGFIVRDGTVLHALYIDPARRGQGLGRLLLMQAKTEADALQLWVLEANHAARLFYVREGFEEVARGHGAGNDEGLPDILMVWRGQGGAA
ncbi:putative acetyltransferase [Roseovarius azorensis]|uniref:Putative acetyltransferase n=1 Tax=Roseovarius azorensis TaxID=1287727 RepID=A0A1H7VBK7_9RHOB|nr:GNAT family N-acetyltransferase [Roseovarius azorensis]SEM06147.1 putative acetyltransferase [Roseovarius azorensis]